MVKPTRLSIAVATSLNPAQEGLPRMKIDFATVLTDLDGKPLKAPGADGTVKDLTLAAASREALLAMTEAAAKESGEAKFKAWELASKIKPEEVEISPEDAAFLKGKIASVYGAAVVGPAFMLLNG